MDVVSLANLALDHVGTRSTISSLTEGSTESNAVSRWYDACRRELLRAAHWNFARKQDQLSLLLDGTKTPPDPVPPPWVFEYAVPSRSLKVRSLMPQFQSLPNPAGAVPIVPNFIGPAVRFMMASDVDVTGNDIEVILTNQPQAIAVYTADITNPNIWDSQFFIALSHLLASRICNSLSGSMSIAKQQFDLANNAVIAARMTNGNEGITVDEHTPDWIRVRGYMSDWGYPEGSQWFYGPDNLTLVT